jgi:hypothetical protein
MSLREGISSLILFLVITGLVPVIPLRRAASLIEMAGT